MGYKSQIAAALISKIENVTVANGYSLDVKTVKFDKVRLNIAEYTDNEIPAVQIIDLTRQFQHVRGKSDSRWILAVEMCLRSNNTIGVVDQNKLWDFEEDVMRAIMKDPTLGLPFMYHVKLLDSATDLHLQGAEYISTLGLEILYKEPVTGSC